MSECPYCGEPLTEDGECDDAGCAFDLVPIGDGTSDHDFMVGQNFFADEPYAVLPECSCGWEGQGTSTVEDAQEQWENHCDVVFMEATTSGRLSPSE